MERLASTSSLVVSQRKEWGEILSGFEGKNKYAVLDEVGRQLFLAAEEPGSMILRWILKAHRPFTIAVLTEGGLLKEGFSDADNFGVVFPAAWDVRVKALFLGAVFLIDFVHFENKGNN